MKIVFLSIITCVLILNNASSYGPKVLGDTNSPMPQNSKLDTRIISFLDTENKTTFAIKNNLNYHNGTLQVYLFLNNVTSLQLLPKNIQIQRIEGITVQASLSQQEIIDLSNAGFVRQITIPSYTMTNQTSQVNHFFNQKTENSVFSLFYILIPIVGGLFFTLVKIRKLKKTKLYSKKARYDNK